MVAEALIALQANLPQARAAGGTMVAQHEKPVG